MRKASAFKYDVGILSMKVVVARPRENTKPAWSHKCGSFKIHSAERRMWVFTFHYRGASLESQRIPVVSLRCGQ